MAGNGKNPGPNADFDQAVAGFVEYLSHYRSYSPLTTKAYQNDLRLFREFLDESGPLPHPESIERQTVVRFAVSLSGMAPITVRRKLACLSSFFSYLQDMGLVRGNPARRLPLPKPTQPLPITLSEEQAARLVNAAYTPWLRALVILLLGTGIRRSEAAAVTLDDLDLEEGSLIVHGKGSKERMVPLNQGVVEAIQEYLLLRPQTECRRLFVSRDGQPFAGRVVNRMLGMVVKRAGLFGQGITPHKLRHTFAT